jgi:hypothetical protein
MPYGCNRATRSGNYDAQEMVVFSRGVARLRPTTHSQEAVAPMSLLDVLLKVGPLGLVVFVAATVILNGQFSLQYPRDRPRKRERPKLKP